MPHSTLWQSTTSIPSNSDTERLHPLSWPKEEEQSQPLQQTRESTVEDNFHAAGRCPCAQEPTSPRSQYRRRQSQQSSLAKLAMATVSRQGDDRHSGSDDERPPRIENHHVEQLRSSLDRALSPTLEKRKLDAGHTSGASPTLLPKPMPQLPKGTAMASALHGHARDHSGHSIALNDTPAATAPASPRMYGNQSAPTTSLAYSAILSLPMRQLSSTGTSTPRARPTTLDIPGLTKSKVSPDGRIAQRDVGAKLVIIMVGLPARGKSYITKKLARYLNWLQHDTRIFNVGERRRVAAGSSNTWENTKPAESNGPRSLGVQSDTVGVSRRAIEKAAGNTRPVSAAQILLNGVTKVEPPTPTQTTAEESRNGDADPEHLPVELLESRFPEMVKAQAHQASLDGAPQTPDDGKMDQSASFFDPANKKATLIREQLALNTLEELLDYILDQNGSVGILDATNSTLERRKMIMRRIRERAGPELNVLFLESRCLDQDLLESNMRLKLGGPDYKDMDPAVALADFRKRIAVYETAYVPLGEYEEKNNMPYIQMIDVGRKIISHQIKGFLSAQANYYLLNFNLAPRQIWITRHGLSEDNLSGKIGGDSELSEEGKAFAKSLAQFMDTQRQLWDSRQLENAQNTHFPPQPGDATPPNPYYTPSSATEPQQSSSLSSASSDSGSMDYSQKPFCVWTSMLKRSIQTAVRFPDETYDVKQMRMLDELNAGHMEGLTYSCISSLYPEEYAARKKDKLHYRYPGPGGEGYLDIINRLRPVIVELERMEESVLLIGHRSVARVLLAYFRGLDRREVAELEVPIGVLYCLEPKPYGVDVKVYRWDRRTEWFNEIRQEDIGKDERVER
nr:hypothetical protein B0A51_01625 [Rachicladosporium sp. CCFEE 5018]